MRESGLHKHNHQDGNRAGAVHPSGIKKNMAVYVFLSADSAYEKTLMLTLMLMYDQFTLKYSQQKHEKMKKVPFLVLMLMFL